MKMHKKKLKKKIKEKLVKFMNRIKRFKMKDMQGKNLQFVNF